MFVAEDTIAWQALNVSIYFKVRSITGWIFIGKDSARLVNQDVGYVVKLLWNKDVWVVPVEVSSP